MTLDDGQKFGHWDRIRFRWRRPNDDRRVESRRVDQDTLRIVGELQKSKRERFLAGSIVTSLGKEREAGRSLALLKAEIIQFKVENKDDADLMAEAQKFEALRAQPDLFNTKSIIPYKPCPYRFKYRYRTDDGVREGTCQDWEIEATFFKWANLYSERRALADIKRVFGVEYPAKGMLFAMGTHSLHPNTWLINGVVRLDNIQQLSLF